MIWARKHIDLHDGHHQIAADGINMENRDTDKEIRFKGAARVKGFIHDTFSIESSSISTAAEFATLMYCPTYC